MLQKLTSVVVTATRSLCLQKQPPKPALQFFPFSMNKSAKKPRYDGRCKKRQWEDRRSDKIETDTDGAKQPKLETLVPRNENDERLKRRKYVLLLGYSGVDYYGMQRNPYTRTIEEDLLKALRKVNLITDNCYNQVQNMQFQRAARTDKGVSAARQVVSMKMYENVDIEKINENLPDAIRVFAYRRVTKGFNSKSQCDGRTYIYITPTVAFAKHGEPASQTDYRLDDETHKKINDVLKKFVGTKNFHNFTSKKKYNDPSATRFIKSFECEKPFVRDGVEFVVLKVYGQSFMLHQIRKMVGLLLAVIKGIGTEETLTQAFTKEKLIVPRAPGLGLVLDFVHYERYNYRYGEDGMHEKLLWDDVEDKVQEFKEKFIYPTIVNTEIKEESMVNWINNKLARHSYNEEDEDDDEKDENDSDDEDGNNGKGFNGNVTNEKVTEGECKVEKLN
ncbi:pseudouridylate synthase 1 homolog [Aethina tumida]|uniref:pseudouridylate synthase 1 homolog n=1 Tax=Aethina tumida TaxID=116153 RepID=UPI0021483B7C|nr:pseudouridylate synthase 1 homolog [Aethina tumida]